jgi:NSS family neurotransmitter:Na+ symporter
LDSERFRSFHIGIPSALSFGVLSAVSIAGRSIFDLPIFQQIVSRCYLARVYCAVCRLSDKKVDVREELLRGSSMSDGLFGAWSDYLCVFAIVQRF